MPVVFLRLWRKWLKIEKYDVNSNFISDQTYRDMIISGHSLILAVKVFAKYYPEVPFSPWLFGSDQCEKLFAKIRCFQKTKTNVALIEMIDICGRLRKLSEKHALSEQNQTAITLPKRSKGAEDQLESNYMFPHWPDDFEDTITRSMKTAEAKALETMDRSSFTSLTNTHKKKIDNYVVDSCRLTCSVVLLLNKELGKVKYCTIENHLYL